MLRFTILLFFSYFLFPSTVFSQDIIIKQNGEEIVGFVTNIGMNKITYRINTDGPVYSIFKSEVYMIKESDGKEYIIESGPSPNPRPKGSEGETGRGRYSSSPSNSDNKQAQNYKFAAGLRLGYPTSATIKLFVSDKHALEVYAGTRGYTSSRWTNVSGAYQVHSNPIDGLGGLKWYTGVGGSVFFWSFDDGFLGDFASTSYGLQGYLGLEYVFDDIPLSISVDWIPTYFLGDGVSITGFDVDYGTVGVRYIISK